MWLEVDFMQDAFIGPERLKYIGVAFQILGENFDTPEVIP